MTRSTQDHPFNCPSCGTSRFRPSRFRMADLPYLLLLRLPIRCAICTERSHLDYRTVLRLLHERQERFLVPVATFSRGVDPAPAKPTVEVGSIQTPRVDLPPVIRCVTGRTYQVESDRRRRRRNARLLRASK